LGHEVTPNQARPKLASASVERRVDFTPDHFKLWLEPSIPFPFVPGQYCTIGVDGIERPYSIVSSPREPLLELFVELIWPPNGRLTPLLHRLRVGDTVTLRPRAKGKFVINQDRRCHVMVATVTGIAPFVSMLRHALSTPLDGAAFYVLQGASYVDELGYDAELTALAAQHANLEFVATCSRPQEPRNAQWHGETGRVNSIVEHYVREWALEPAETCIYVCGNPQMIEDVTARYASTGFQVETEGFWKNPQGRRRRNRRSPT
jgi:ferredoxin/flavodoxin---NADP+ reductase